MTRYKKSKVGSSYGGAQWGADDKGDPALPGVRSMSWGKTSAQLDAEIAEALAPRPGAGSAVPTRGGYKEYRPAFQTQHGDWIGDDSGHLTIEPAIRRADALAHEGSPARVEQRTYDHLGHLVERHVVYRSSKKPRHHSTVAKTPTRSKSADPSGIIRRLGGSFRFSDRNKMVQAEDRARGPRWTAFVNVFGYDVSGEGAKKSEALSAALTELPEHLRRHFV
jgi:hypothetical protein